MNTITGEGFGDDVMGTCDSASKCDVICFVGVVDLCLVSVCCLLWIMGYRCADLSVTGCMNFQSVSTATTFLFFLSLLWLTRLG